MVEEILIRALEGLEHEIKKAIQRLRHHFPKHPKCRHYSHVRQVFIIHINKNKFIIMNQIRIDKGQHVVAALLDKDTNQPIAGATKELVSRTVADTTIVIVDGNGDLIPQKLGATQLTEVNKWTYPDRDNPGQSLTEELTTTLDIQVINAPEGLLQVVTLQEFDLPAAPAAGGTTA